MWNDVASAVGAIAFNTCDESIHGLFGQRRQVGRNAAEARIPVRSVLDVVPGDDRDVVRNPDARKAEGTDSAKGEQVAGADEGVAPAETWQIRLGASKAFLSPKPTSPDDEVIVGDSVFGELLADGDGPLLADPGIEIGLVAEVGEMPAAQAQQVLDHFSCRQWLSMAT